MKSCRAASTALMSTQGHRTPNTSSQPPLALSSLRTGFTRIATEGRGVKSISLGFATRSCLTRASGSPFEIAMGAPRHR